VETVRGRQIFSTAAPPAACAAACAALEIIETEPTRRERLLGLALRLRQGIAALGLETVCGGTGPIVPVLLRDPRSAMLVARRLEERGFLVGAMRPPSVPAGTSRLRIGVTAVNTVEDIVALLGRFRKSGDYRARSVNWRSAIAFKRPNQAGRNGFSGPRATNADARGVRGPSTPSLRIFFDLDGLRYHYVDEGSGPTLLLVHGNPTGALPGGT